VIGLDKGDTWQGLAWCGRDIDKLSRISVCRIALDHSDENTLVINLDIL